MMQRVLVISIVGIVLAACSKPSLPPVTTRESTRVVSPAGWCVASVVVFEDPATVSNTQVLLSFDGGRCGAGAVSFDGADVPLQLHWIDATTLEVRHPRGASFSRNASGDFLYCLERKVHVVLSPA